MMGILGLLFLIGFAFFVYKLTSFKNTYTVDNHNLIIK